jgi:hypothetical protein
MVSNKNSNLGQSAKWEVYFDGKITFLRARKQESGAKINCRVVILVLNFLTQSAQRRITKKHRVLN